MHTTATLRSASEEARPPAPENKSKKILRPCGCGCARAWPPRKAYRAARRPARARRSARRSGSCASGPSAAPRPASALERDDRGWRPRAAA
eukprot:5918304-Pyramimonas_sp.AAC.1